MITSLLADAASNPGAAATKLLGVIGVVVSKLNALKVAQVTGDIPQNVNFAVALPPLKAMLAQHAVPLESGPAPAELTRQQVAEAARLYTTAVLCAR